MANTTSAEITSFTQNSWHTLTVSSGATLTAETVYWMALFADGETNQVSFDGPRGGSSVTVGLIDQTYGAFPADGTGYFAIGTNGDGLYMVMDLGANKWQASVTTQPHIVTASGTRGTLKAGVSSIESVGDWYWASDLLYTYSVGDPSSTIEAAQRNYNIYNTERSFFTVQDLTLNLANINNFSNDAVAGATSGITVQGNTASHARYTGIYFKNGHATEKTTAVLIDNNEVYECGTAGINVAEGVNSLTISRNTVHHNNWSTEPFFSGIHVWGNLVDALGLVIEHNKVYSQYFGATPTNWRNGNGIYVDEVGDGPIIRYNLIYNNTQTGFFLENTEGAQVYYNVIYGNGTSGSAPGMLLYRAIRSAEVYNNTIYGNDAGIALVGLDATERDMTGNIIKNNIVFNNTYEELVTKFGAENDGTMGSGNVYEYNCFGPEGSNFIQWGNGTFKATYDAWETSYGGTTASVEVDPQFISTTNFYLKASSPAINAGANVSLTSDFSGNGLVGAPDIGAYEFASQRGMVITGGAFQ